MNNYKQLIALLLATPMIHLQGFNEDQLAYVKDRSMKHEKIMFFYAWWSPTVDDIKSDYGVGANGSYTISRDSRLDLTDAKLPEAYLVQAQLGNANLIGANLKKAKLRQAYLVRANLIRANLEGADLRGADLIDAVLDSANLHGALINDQTKGDIEKLKRLGAVDLNELDADALAVFFQRWQLIKTSEETSSSNRVPIITDQIGSAGLLPAFDNDAIHSTQPVEPLIRPAPIYLHVQGKIT